MASLAAKAVAAAVAPKGSVPIRTSTGIVIRAGTCDKTVKIRLGGENWNKKVKKYFKKPEEHLVHDPNNSLQEGDVIEVQNSFRTSKQKRFVVNKIIAPFGKPIDERPPVPTVEEREATKAVKREAKLQRRELRKTRLFLEAQVKRSMKSYQRVLESTGLDPKVLLRKDGVAPIVQDQHV